MAKDLPYFKFNVSEWNDGDVTLCSLEAQGLFINLCSLYWSQEGQLSYTKAKRRYYQCNTTVWDELINDGIIKVSGDAIIITFLDEQFAEREKLSAQNKKNIEKRWKNADHDTTVLPSNNVGTVPVYNIEEKRKEEKRTEKKRGEESDAAKAAHTQKSLEDREKEFMELVAKNLDSYPKEMLRAFYDYWTEKNEGGRRMRFEMQKVFDIKKRLVTWKNNDKVDRIKREVISKQFALDSLSALHETFREKMKQDTAKASDARKALKTRISALEGKIRKITLANATPRQLDSVRVIIAPQQSDSMYCLPIESARVIMADAVSKRVQDTLLVQKDSLIGNLNHENGYLKAAFGKNDTIWQARYDTLSSITDSKELIIQTYEKKERRAAFKSWLEKVGAVAAGVLIGLLISN